MSDIVVNIKRNKNLNFLLNSLDVILKEREKESAKYQYLLLEGSSRSGKTWAILIFLITLCLQPSLVGREKVVVRAYRNDGATCEDTIIADFIAIMNSFFCGYSKSSMTEETDGFVSLYEAGGRYNISRRYYTFANGSQIYFHGASEPQKLQGKKADITWFNEAMEITDAARSQVEFRTTLFIICDWNPSETEHWIFDNIMTDKDAHLYCHSTYHDNIENLTPAQVYSIEKYEPTTENKQRGTANEWLWLVYGEGKRGVRENTVFERWRWDIIDVDDFPEKRSCQRFGYGLDFGFSVDPTALVRCALCNDCIYIHEEIYESGIHFGRSYDNPNFPSVVGYLEELGVPKSERISADKACGEGISQISTAGYNIFGTPKPKGSIIEGIELMKQHRIFITRSSKHLIKEFENYIWHRKPDGTILNEPEDRYNHGIDAARYWALDNLKATNIQANNRNLRPVIARTGGFDQW